MKFYFKDFVFAVSTLCLCTGVTIDAMKKEDFMQLPALMQKISIADRIRVLKTKSDQSPMLLHQLLLDKECPADLFSKILNYLFIGAKEAHALKDIRDLLCFRDDHGREGKKNCWDLKSASKEQTDPLWKSKWEYVKKVYHTADECLKIQNTRNSEDKKRSLAVLSHNKSEEPSKNKKPKTDDAINLNKDLRQPSDSNETIIFIDLTKGLDTVLPQGSGGGSMVFTAREKRNAPYKGSRLARRSTPLPVLRQESTVVEQESSDADMPTLYFPLKLRAKHNKRRRFASNNINAKNVQSSGQKQFDFEPKERS